MFVTDENVMEDIVSNNSNLSWEGWDVLRWEEKRNAMLNTKGRFRDGKWHLVTRFPLTSEGWKVPKFLLKK